MKRYWASLRDRLRRADGLSVAAMSLSLIAGAAIGAVFGAATNPHHGDLAPLQWLAAGAVVTAVLGAVIVVGQPSAACRLQQSNGGRQNTPCPVLEQVLAVVSAAACSTPQPGGSQQCAGCPQPEADPKRPQISAYGTSEASSG